MRDIKSSVYDDKKNKRTQAMTTVFQSTHADGSPLMLPFPYGPRREDNVPISNNVWWLAKGEELCLLEECKGCSQTLSWCLVQVQVAGQQ